MVTDISDQIPFDIPEGWEWVRFGNAVINRDNERIPLSVADRIKLEKKYDYYGASGVIDKVDRFLFNIPLLLIGEDGANLLSRSTPIAFITKGQYWVNNHAHVIDTTPWLTLEFIATYINAISLAPYVTGTAQPKMNQEKMNSILLPLPPLSEQHRIVAKIEELLPYIDRYDEAERKLTTLNNEFPDKLKKSILQMAVQGKLVPQNPDDEPASVLLEKIRAEKERLIKQGKIKRDKSESAIYHRDNEYYEKQNGVETCISEQIPFEIPEGWEWCRLGSISDIARGGSPRPIKQYITESEDGVNWIKISDSDKGEKYINHTKEKIIKDGMLKSRFVHSGDFLLTNSMSFGRPYILNVDGCIHDGWLVISRYQTVYDKNFLYYMLLSSFAYYQFCNIVSGAVVKNLNSDKVSDSLFPIPPLTEQHRIVTKIEEILPLCEKLS